MDKLDKSLIEYASITEYQEHISSQQKVISSLNKKIDELKKEIDLYKENKPQIVYVPEGNTIDDEELICRAEIAKLKELSLTRHLTYEETKKLEIYTKILNNIKNNIKPIEMKAKEISTDSLLNAAENDIKNINVNDDQTN